MFLCFYCFRTANIVYSGYYCNALGRYDLNWCSHLKAHLTKFFNELPYLSAAAFVIHVIVAEVIRDEQRFVIECRHQRIGARVRVLDTDLDRIIFGEAAMRIRRRRADFFFGLCSRHAAVR